MKKTKKIDKNILFEQFMAYFLKNPQIGKKLPDNANLVIFSATDKSLNIENDELIKTLTTEGKPIVKVEQTNKRNEPWVVTPLVM